jgi:hypothetical protein
MEGQHNGHDFESKLAVLCSSCVVYQILHLVDLRPEFGVNQLVHSNGYDFDVNMTGSDEPAHDISFPATINAPAHTFPNPSDDILPVINSIDVPECFNYSSSLSHYLRLTRSKVVAFVAFLHVLRH